MIFLFLGPFKDKARKCCHLGRRKYHFSAFPQKERVLMKNCIIGIKCNPILS
jgi:hypothetical protein